MTSIARDEEGLITGTLGLSLLALLVDSEVAARCGRGVVLVARAAGDGAPSAQRSPGVRQPRRLLLWPAALSRRCPCRAPVSALAGAPGLVLVPGRRADLV